MPSDIFKKIVYLFTLKRVHITLHCSITLKCKFPVGIEKLPSLAIDCDVNKLVAALHLRFHVMDNKHTEIMIRSSTSVPPSYQSTLSPPHL